MNKTQAGIGPMDPKNPGYAAAVSRVKEVRRRIAAAHPERLCDDARKWPRIWRGLLKRSRDLSPRVEEIRDKETWDSDDAYSYGEDPMAESEEERDHYWYMVELTNRD